MPKITYVSRKFSEGAESIITKANRVLDEYEKQGFDLTLRQLYYQFVRRDWFPAAWADPATGSTNNEKSYKKLGSIVNDARLAGLIDWDRIIDRTRNLRGLSHWASPADIVESVSRQFRINMWDSQPHRVEVWIEKDALIGVIEGICERYDVPYFSCRGYTSQSEMWSASRRLAEYADRGQKPVVLHFGDHDPSGVDMSRDILDRITMFVEHDTGNPESVEIRRIALMMSQVKEYNPPPNPAKITDSRAKEYIREHGDESWELDALEPSVISDLIESEITALIEHEPWVEAEKKINDGRKELATIAKRWDKAVKAVGKK